MSGRLAKAEMVQAEALRLEVGAFGARPWVLDGTAGFRRRGRDALVANPFLSGGPLVRRGFLPVHMP